MPTCFVCQRPALQLAGQWLAFDTYNCCSFEDDDLIDARAFGDAHLPCLRQSGWGVRWAKRWIEGIRASGWHEVGGDGDYATFHWDGGLPRVAVIRVTGERWEYHDRQASRVVSGSLGPVIRHKEEFNFDLSASPGLAAEVQSALTADGAYPLPQLIG